MRALTKHPRLTLVDALFLIDFSSLWWNSRAAERGDLRCLVGPLPPRAMRAIVETVRCRRAPQTPAPEGFGGVGPSAARRTLDDEHRITFAHRAPHLEPTALELSRAGVSPQAASVLIDKFVE